MTLLPIGEGTQVTLHFALKLKGGEVVDSTFEGDPATFVVGDGNLLEGFEQSLFGLTEGSKETFTISPEKAFGQVNPNNRQEFARYDFGNDVELQEGLVLAFADAQNTETPGVILAYDDDSVTVDFNHPLAGKNIYFQVEIIAVTPATKH